MKAGWMDMNSAALMVASTAARRAAHWDNCSVVQKAVCSAAHWAELRDAMWAANSVLSLAERTESPMAELKAVHLVVMTGRCWAAMMAEH